nr:radical SAM protein [uncultured Aminipila sp.]
MFENNLDILLLSMPVRAIDRPSLSLPVLTSHLKKQGISVVQMDNNMMIQDELLEVKELEYLLNTILPFLFRLNLNRETNMSKIKSFYTLLSDIEKSYGFNKLVDMKRKMQENDFAKLSELENVRIVEDIFNLSSHFQFYFTVVTYYYEYFLRNGIHEKVTLHMKKLFEEIVAANPMVVGFSVMEVQRAFSLWASEKLRDDYDGYILFGGSDIVLNKEKYLIENQSIDFACRSDGEEAVTSLIQILKTNSTDFSSVPNLIFRNNKDIVITEHKEYPISDYNVPDYDNFPLDKYIFSSLQILTSKGCSWSKCMFCMHWKSYGQNFRQRTAKSVVDEMEHYINKYGVRLFSIVDESISAEFGLALSNEIINRNLSVRWIQMSRLDSDFNITVFEKLHKAGCRFIEWGLETGSQKVLDDMQKGIDVIHVQRIIHEAASAGIVNKMLMFHNYPTESIDDLMKSINIIRRNTYERLVKPMLTLRHAFVLKYGSPLAEIAFSDSEVKDEYFKKVWKSDSVFNVNTKYIAAINGSEVKKRLINDYLSEIKSYLKTHNVLITNNNNITMDLVLVELLESGYSVPVDVFLPYRLKSVEKNLTTEYKSSC